jgi:hypothetical protein
MEGQEDGEGRKEGDARHVVGACQPALRTRRVTKACCSCAVRAKVRCATEQLMLMRRTRCCPASPKGSEADGKLA